MREHNVREYKSRRNSSEMDVLMLKAIKSGTVTPTRIMYASRTSWTPLKKRLTALVERSMIESYSTGKKQSHTHYRLTARGEAFIKAWDELQEAFY